MTAKELEKLITTLLQHLEIKPEKIEIQNPETDTIQANLTLSDQDTGMLIGHHGDTISALQLLLGLILYKQSGSWTRLIVDIGDYRAKRTASLEKLAQDTAQRVKFSNEPIALFNLNPFERRAIHIYLEGHPDVATESDGEGRNRHLIIKPKNPSPDPVPSSVDDLVGDAGSSDHD